MKSIAILVPAYNSVSTLEATLKSILSLNDELVQHIDFVMLSDDGSKDETIALAERIWTHPTVPLQVKRAIQNQGEYRNVNGAFAAMPPHIEWVLIMHADNQALPGWISLLARECERAHPKTATICGSWEYVVDDVTMDHGDAKGSGYVEDVPGTPESVRGSLLKGCWWHNSTAAVRVTAWKDVGGHPQEIPLLSPCEILGWCAPPSPPARKLRIKGDWDVLLRFLSSGWGVRYIGTPLIRYIELSSSVSAGSFAWHGDLLETLQVMRNHQSALSRSDILRFHITTIKVLMRRMAGAFLRGQWKRAWFAFMAFPTMAISLFVSLLNHQRGIGGVLKSIPFGPDQKVA